MANPTVVLSPQPKQQFFLVGNAGVPAAGAFLWTYTAGTTTKQNTYTDSTGGTPSANPIVLDSNGQCTFWIDVTLLYKYTLAPATDVDPNTLLPNDPPQNPLWTINGISDLTTAAINTAVSTAVANTFPPDMMDPTFAQMYAAITGRHSIPVVAAAIAPSATGGCAVLAQVASAANQPDIITLDFDPTTQQYAQVSIPMPKSWNRGPVTFVPIWSHPATTTNFGVVWSLQAVAVSNNDAIAVAYGTGQTSTDTGGVTNSLYMGPESAAITIAGNPAAEDVVFFRISVVPGGATTIAVKPRLHAVVVYITTNAPTDA